MTMGTHGSRPRYGMVVDLNRCVGCQTCTVACKHANDTTPDVQWRRVLDVETGTFPDVQRLFLVVGCQHCANPPCVPVCPTGATFQRPDGLVAMDYDLCIGCGYCAVACPYQARTIAHDQDWYFGGETRQESKVSHPERIGVAQKCTFCAEKIDDAHARQLIPGVDLDVTPACASACIAQAIHFGDFNDAHSNVSRLAAENSSFQMHEGLGTDPQIKYLYETPAVPGREGGDETHLADPQHPMTGAPQTFWDLRAATNFIAGGAGAGAVVIACAAWLLGALDHDALVQVFAASAVLMAIGLFAVFLEIGRKARFLYTLLRPQSSWMTREVYCVALFYPLVLANLVLVSWKLPLATAVAALGFLYCQARILHAGVGVPVWRAPLVPALFVAGGLLEGAALVGVFVSKPPTGPDAVAALAQIGLLLVVLNAGLWHAYRRTAQSAGVAPLGRDALARATPWIHTIGHLVPAVLLVVALGDPPLGPVLLTMAALAMLAGGVMWKVTVIIHASHQQGFSLPKLPQRGSGTLAAP